MVNASLIELRPGHDGVELLSLRCTDIARAAGDDRLVSVVALGGLIARRPIVRIESILQAFAELLGPLHGDRLEADLAAFEGGYSRAELAQTA